MSPSTSWQACIFIVALVASILLIFNIRPFVASLIVWITGISILNRNELVINGADHYVIMLSFWSMLLSTRRFKLASMAGYFGQLALLYLFTGLAKVHFDPWKDGSAMRDILSLDVLTRPHSQKLLTFETLLTASTWGTLAIELLAPVAILFALFNLRTRLIILVILATMHLGIVILLNLYFIPVMSLVSLIPLIPETIWSKNPQAKESASVLSWTFVSFILLLFLSSNIKNLPSRPLTFPTWMDRAITSVRLDQDWSFYAPPPSPGYDAWWIIGGSTSDGRPAQPWTGEVGVPARAKPAVLSNHYPNQHWVSYFMNLGSTSNPKILDGLANFLCRRWNRTADHQPLETIVIERLSSIDDGAVHEEFSHQANCRTLE
ncbi:MAG: hypothetical protein K2X47_12070 [Bdellovibrionales bacterium]|nr:hypothetical protein [Bdellovibrionales bacterium]